MTTRSQSITTPLPCDNFTHLYDSRSCRDRYWIQNPSTLEWKAVNCQDYICPNRYSTPVYAEIRSQSWAKTPNPDQLSNIVQAYNLGERQRQNVQQELVARATPQPTPLPTPPVSHIQQATSSSSHIAAPSARRSASTRIPSSPATSVPRALTPRIPVSRQHLDLTLQFQYKNLNENLLLHTNPYRNENLHLHEKTIITRKKNSITRNHRKRATHLQSSESKPPRILHLTHHHRLRHHPLLATCLTLLSQMFRRLSQLFQNSRTTAPILRFGMREFKQQFAFLAHPPF